jgi:hypothetical protein
MNCIDYIAIAEQQKTVVYHNFQALDFITPRVFNNKYYYLKREVQPYLKQLIMCPSKTRKFQNTVPLIRIHLSHGGHCAGEV